MERAIFLDRDGVINEIYEDKLFVCDIEQVKLCDGVVEWLLMLKKMWFLLVVITNQTWIWAWYYTKEQLKNVNNEIQRQMWFKFDGIYACTLPPKPDNPCRKPNPKMVFQASKDLNIDISKSYFVWDKSKDVQTWQNAKCLGTCLVSWNYQPDETVKPDFVVNNLLEFAKIVWKTNNKS